MFGLFKSKPPQIRLAQINDAGFMAQLHGQSFAHGWALSDIVPLLRDKNNLALLLSVKEQPQGFLLIKTVLDEAEILSIVLAQKMRGRGYSALLLKSAYPYLIRQGTKSLFLEVESENKPALALYNAQGFVKIGERKSYYGVNKHAITMQKLLPLL